METTSKTGIQYISNKKKYELDESFYNRCWYITEKSPTTDTSFKEAIKLSELRQNNIDYGCIYTVKKSVNKTHF